MENYEQQEKNSIVDYFADLFFDPNSLAERIIKKPRILVPLIIGIILSTAIMFILKDLMIESIVRFSKDLEHMKDLPPDQLKQMVSSQYNIGMLIGAISPIIVLLINAAIFFVLGKLFKSQALFKELMSLIAFGYIIALIGGLITAFIQVFTQNVSFDLSLVALLPHENMVPGLTPTKWYYSLAALVNPFTIWYYAVIVIGLSKLGNLKKSQSILIVVIVVALGQAFNILNALLTGAQAGI
ncbi:MAG: YIP1 family protein [Peptostreptococcaceae bacterium]|nr:YIP1 family protein [Peptostreptococcaceae bacterium]